MKENGLGKMFIRHLVIAIPWGIVFLVVFFVAGAGIKQQVKEGIEYTMKTALKETTRIALSHRVFPRVKQNIKEAIEFVAQTGKKEIKGVLKDPEIKQDMKEALEYSGKKFR